MTGLSLALTVLFAAPASCPPDVGQIRWDGVQHGMKSTGVQVTGSIWDRDRDGKPSRGDVMRIDEARRRGAGMAIDEVWVVIDGKLARGLARSVKNSRGLRMMCETPFEVQGVPRMKSDKALARHLRGGGDAAEPAQRMSKADQARADMAGWADQLCQSKRHISKNALSKRLEAHSARKHRKLRRKTRQRLAREVAQEYAMACARLDVPQDLTF